VNISCFVYMDLTMTKTIFKAELINISVFWVVATISILVNSVKKNMFYYQKWLPSLIFLSPVYVFVIQLDLKTSLIANGYHTWDNTITTIVWNGLWLKV